MPHMSNLPWIQVLLLMSLFSFYINNNLSNKQNPLISKMIYKEKVMKFSKKW